jgi:hypothetical protein
VAVHVWSILGDCAGPEVLLVNLSEEVGGCANKELGLELSGDLKAEDRERHWYNTHPGALAPPSKGRDSSCVPLTLLSLALWAVLPRH